MPLSQAAQDLTDLVGAADTIELLLAFKVKDGALSYEIRRLQMQQNLLDALKRLLVRSLKGFDEDPMDFNSDRQLRHHEWFQADVDLLGLAALRDTFVQAPRVTLMDTGRLDHESPAWYALVPYLSQQRWAGFVRRSRQMISAGAKLLALIRGDTVRRLPERSRTIRFDDAFDVVVQPDRTLLANTDSYDLLFADRDALAAAVPTHVAALALAAPHVNISNAPAFVAACQTNFYMMRKLERVIQTGSYKKLTRAKILKLIADYNIDPSVYQNGQFVFTGSPKQRWAILKILDEDYLRSDATGNRFESSSKVQVK